jgi:septum site-determining protein MinC
MVVEEIPSDTVIARGTEDGLVLRVDGRNSFERLRAALQAFLSSRKGFLRGSKVISIEWLFSMPSPESRAALIDEIRESFGLQINEINGAERQECVPDAVQPIGSDIETEAVGNIEVTTEKIVAALVEKKERSRSSSRAEALSKLDTSAAAKRTASKPIIRSRESGSSSRNDLETQALINYTTLRSGQRIQSEHTVVIVGDVNSGAEVIAGGDVIILGNLRGIAHAGAFQEDGGGRMILALGLRPTQLRIGSFISRGSPESGGGSLEQGPEFARVLNEAIVVAPYTSTQGGGLFQGRRTSRMKGTGTLGDR